MPKLAKMFGASRSSSGYFDQTENFNSPGGTDKKKYDTKNQKLFPIVVGMINENNSDELIMWGEQVHLVKIVGIVKKLCITSTKLTYNIEDISGKINAVFWLDQDQDEEPNLPVDKEGKYVEVYGTVRKHRDEKLIMILKIHPISSMNIITTHLLEVIHTRYELEHTFKNPGMINSNTNPGVALSNSMMFSNSQGQSNMTPTQSKVFNMIKYSPAKAGLYRPAILEHFPKPQHNEVLNAIELLVSEGFIFSTIDADHFKVTDM